MEHSSGDEPVKKLGGGRLQQRQLSDDSKITISSDLDIELPIEQPKKKIKKDVKKKREPKIKQIQENNKKSIIANEQILEKYKNDPRFQEAESEGSVKSINTEDEDDLHEQKQKKMIKNKKQNKGGISNRHKFFKHFSEEDQLVQQDAQIFRPEEFEYQEGDLVFAKGQEQSEQPKEQAHRQVIEKAQQYKQKVAVFESTKSMEEQPNLNTIMRQPSSNPDEFLRRVSSIRTEATCPDELQLELIMPKVGAKNSVIDGTLFINKMRQQGQGITKIQGTQKSLPINKNSQSYSRSEFQRLMKDKINERRSRNVNLEELLKRFQHTKLEQIQTERDQDKKAERQNQAENEQQDGESSSDEELKSQDLAELCESNPEEENDPQYSNSLGNPMQEEENDDEGENDKGQSKGEIEDRTSMKDEGSSIKEVQELPLETYPVSKLLVFSEDEEAGNEEIVMFSKLRKISQTMRLKKQEEQAKMLQREQRRKELKELRKHVKNTFLENEAELGSDDEAHDDVVKPTPKDEEEEDNEDAYLAELIDDQIGDINEENEERAYKIFLQKIREQDKAQIRKILRGEFKGNNQKRDMTAELLGNQNNEAARLARMEECMKILRERDNDVDDNNDDEDEIQLNNNQENLKDMRQQMREEKLWQAQVKVRNFLAKNNGRKVDDQLPGIFDPSLVNKITQQAQPKPNSSNISQNNFKIFGQLKSTNSFINRNKNSFSTIADQNLGETNNNSNSISILNKPDKKPNKNFALNKLFASCQNNTNLNQQITKSPNKLLIFGQRRRM